MQDDPVRSLRANRLFASLTPDQSGFMPMVVVVEKVGAPSLAFDLARDQVADVTAVGCAETFTFDSGVVNGRGMVTVS